MYGVASICSCAGELLTSFLPRSNGSPEASSAPSSWETLTEQKIISAHLPEETAADAVGQRVLYITREIMPTMLSKYLAVDLTLNLSRRK